jgi:hypothetical protein
MNGALRRRRRAALVDGSYLQVHLPSSIPNRHLRSMQPVLRSLSLSGVASEQYGNFFLFSFFKMAFVLGLP